MIWTEKAVNEKLNYLSAGDAHVERGYKDGFKNDKTLYPNFKEYSRAFDSAYGYRCYDKYRPGFSVWGKTPKDAANNAGFWVH